MSKRFANALYHSFITHVGTLTDLAYRIAEVLILFVIARLAISFSAKLVKRLMHSRAVKMDLRRRNTLISLFDNVLKYLIYFIFALLALNALGVHIVALLAGAGIAGITVGLAAQGLIKDVLTGFFILFEDQYGVGDIVQINNFTGKVISIGLRLTRVQAVTGEVAVIPNGQIQQVTNFSEYPSATLIDVPVSPDCDIAQETSALEHALEDIKSATHLIPGQVRVIGLVATSPNELAIRATAECERDAGAQVQLLVRERIKARCETTTP